MSSRTLIEVALLAAALAGPGRAAPAAMQTVTYQADPSDFANPERGFSQQGGSPATARAANMSLIHLYVRLDDYKSRPLTQAFLTDLQQKFAEARAGGVKLIPRFTYNFPTGGPNPSVDTDAPLSRVLQHLDQLAPVLRKNSDVIAFMEAGFVGAWGEWHHSTNGLDATPAEAAILRKLLAILPRSRMVALRYPRDKIAIFRRAAPITSAEAFSGADVARVGHHDDCFLASKDDFGTYRPSDPAALQAQKAYLHAENQYVPQGGETCNAGPEAQPYIQCPHALSELAFLHWSQLNSDYERNVLNLWRTQGCYDEVAKRLGYRFRLIEASVQPLAAPGGRLNGEIRLINDGFASPYNPRPVMLVLRNRASAAEYDLPIDADPRRWAAGEVQTVRFRLRLPALVKPGTYDVLLDLPDPEPSLARRPEYAIRLANLDVWERSTGYNKLDLTVRVMARAGTNRAGRKRPA